MKTGKGFPAALVLAAMMAVPAAAQQKSAAECVGGSPDAPAKIEVFSDFQCPACQTFYLQTMRQVLADYARTNKVCVVYHEMPLAGHAHAREAASYGAAARRLGNEQWIRVADRLFVDQGLWSVTGDVEGTVKKALTPEDFARLQEIRKDPSIAAEIDRDIAEARQRGVQSTPTFFVTVNGREQKVKSAISYVTLKQFLDQELGTR